MCKRGQKSCIMCISFRPETLPNHCSETFSKSSTNPTFTWLKSLCSFTGMEVGYAEDLGVDGAGHIPGSSTTVCCAWQVITPGLHQRDTTVCFAVQVIHRALVPQYVSHRWRWWFLGTIGGCMMVQCYPLFTGQAEDIIYQSPCCYR